MSTILLLKVAQEHCGARDLGPLKWDPGPGTQKFSRATRDQGPLKCDLMNNLLT